jgi:hypothetical protein
MGSLQAPQVGVAVVTIDMFREFQRHIATTFDLQKHQIVALQERVQSIEGRVQSLEDAEDMAIDAVREIRDTIMPRVQQHDESLETLTAAITRQNAIVDALGSLGQEFRANQSRDPVRPAQLAWRPGPLGGATDQTKSTLDEVKTQLTRSFASLAEHDRHLGENDDRLSAHERHLTEHERRFADHDKGLAAHDRHLGDHGTRLGTHDRHFAEHDARLGVHERHLLEHDAGLGKYSGHLGALDKANELVSLAYLGAEGNEILIDTRQLNGRVAVLEQRTDHGLSPTQIAAIMQNHQQRLESLKQTLEQHIESSREAQATKPISPQSRPLSVSGETQLPGSQMGSDGLTNPIQTGEMSQSTQTSEHHSKRTRREDEETNTIPELRRLGEHMEAIDKRIRPLEERLNLVEKDFEKLSQSATTPESVTKDPMLEEEGQFEILRQTNFQRQDDLTGLRNNEDSQLLMQLFSEKDKCEDACYTVQRACVHMWSYLLCRSRKDARLISDFWKRDDWLNYPTFLELERNPSMPKGKYFPRYVYEVGEIFNRKVVTKYNGRQATHRSTGYHLVVDVTKPEKSLWLIYRYEEVGSDGQSLKQSITYKQDSFWHPFASVCEFDIAMIFERFDDWKGTDTPVGSFAASKKLVRQTAALIRPTFIEPVLQEVKDVIRQSWKASSNAIGSDDDTAAEPRRKR